MVTLKKEIISADREQTLIGKTMVVEIGSIFKCLSNF